MTKSAQGEMDVSEKLIQGSIALIAREGSSALGVRRLAEAAERSSMCVYSHFGSRGRLLTAVYERVAHSFLAAVTPDTDARYQPWALENPQLYAFLFDHPLDALGVSGELRAELVGDLVASVSYETWVRLHGEVSYSRITRDAAQRQPSTA